MLNTGSQLNYQQRTDDLYFAKFDDVVQIWDIKAKKQVVGINPNLFYIDDFVLSPVKNELWIYYTNEVEIWDYMTKKIKKNLVFKDKKFDSIEHLALSDDKKFASIVFDFDTVVILDLKNMTIKNTLAIKAEYISKTEFLEGSRLLIQGSQPQIWDISTNKRLFDLY